MSRWTWHVSNETADTFILKSASLDYGDWFGGGEPPPVLEAGHDVSWECESGWLGNIRGVAVYAGALGNVGFTWEVPFLGSPSSNVDPGPYALRRMGPSGDGGAMVAIATPQAQEAPPPSAPPPPPPPAGPPPPAPASHVAPVMTNTVDLKKKDHLYTNSPNERETHRFPIGARELVEATSAGWPEIGAVGARTLVAQWWHETDAGKYCFNYNLGNVKAASAQALHMYLRGVWELVASEKADGVVEKANGLARIATEQECKAHGWTHKATQSVVVFDPPHPAARFLAFDSLSDAVDFWLKKHQRIAGKHDEYLPAIQSGDTSAVAHVLKSIRYYTGDEGAYANGMAAAKAKIDAAFGDQ